MNTLRPSTEQIRQPFAAENASTDRTVRLCAGQAIQATQTDSAYIQACLAYENAVAFAKIEASTPPNITRGYN